MELLVVIAIIGILSSVTLGALSRSRSKAQDAKIKAEFKEIKSQAEFFSDQNGHFGPEASGCVDAGSVFADTRIALLIEAAETASGASMVCVSDNGLGGAGNATSWAVSIPLRSDPLISWCADSAGSAQEATAQISANQALCL